MSEDAIGALAQSDRDQMFAKLKSFAGQSFIYTLGGILTRSISFVLLPLYTRALTPEDYGILGAVSPISAVLGIFLILGIQNALMRFYFDYYHDPVKLRAYMGTVSIFIIISSLVVSSVLTGTGPQLFKLILPQTPFYPYVFLAVWTASLGTIQIIPTTIFRARQQPWLHTLYTTGSFVLTVLVTIVLVVGLRKGAEGVLLAGLIATVLIAIPTFWVIARNSSLSFSWPDIKLSLAFGLPLLPHTLGNWILNLSDRILLENLVTKSELGLYTLAYQFGYMLNIIALALNDAWVPIFYQYVEHPEDGKLVPRFITYQVLSITGLGLAIALLSREVIEIMARPAYQSAYRLVPWVVLGYFARFLYLFPVNGIFYSKDTRLVPLATISAGVLNVGLNVWLIPKYGTLAAAVNTFIGFLALLLMIYAMGQRLFPIRYEYGRLAQIILVATGVFAIGWWFAPTALWPRLAFKLCLLITFPLLLGVSGFLSTDEQRRLVWLGQSIRRRLA